MSFLATPALVLETRDYRETSLLVTLLTPGQGRLGAVAKGVRRPKSSLAGTLQPFALIDARISLPASGGLAVLTAADLTHCPDFTHTRKAPLSTHETEAGTLTGSMNAPNNIAAPASGMSGAPSLARLAYASLFAEILCSTPEHDPHGEDLFFLARAFFLGLEYAEHPGSFSLTGLFALLADMGYAPDPGMIESDIAAGIYRLPAEFHGDFRRVLAAAQTFPEGGGETVSRRAGAPLLRLALFLFESHLERPLRTHRFVEEMVLKQ